MSVDYFVELSRGATPDLDNVDRVATHYHLRVAEGKKEEADKLRSAWGRHVSRVTLSEPSGPIWQLIARPLPDISVLPPCSFALQLVFTLAQPYLSKDDNAFYIIDNPIVRDKVFRLPMVRSTGWKGNLNAALWQLRHDKQKEEQMQRLFGEVRSSAEGEEEGRAGRLFFYPTFFIQTGLEIINPHDRTRRVGKNPILLESVPIGARGTFTLLYIPFDRVGQDETETHRQVAKDLVVLAEGLRAMFTVYGFSAKRTSGFGLAKERVEEGVLTLRIQGLAAPPPETPSAPAPALPRYLEAPGQLKPEYLTPDGRFRERSEAELKAMKKDDRLLYNKAKAWWEREGKALVEGGPPQEAAVPGPAPVPPPAWRSWNFRSFDELVARAEQVAQQLTEGGAL